MEFRTPGSLKTGWVPRLRVGWKGLERGVVLRTWACRPEVDTPARPGRGLAAGPAFLIPRRHGPGGWDSGPAPAPSKGFHRIFALNATRRKYKPFFSLGNSLPPLRPRHPASAPAVSLMEHERDQSRPEKRSFTQCS